MQGMADRLATHGGTLGVCSSPGGGTQVAGAVYEGPGRDVVYDAPR